MPLSCFLSWHTKLVFCLKGPFFSHHHFACRFQSIIVNKRGKGWSHPKCWANVQWWSVEVGRCRDQCLLETHTFPCRTKKLVQNALVLNLAGSELVFSYWEIHNSHRSWIWKETQWNNVRFCEKKKKHHFCFSSQSSGIPKCFMTRSSLCVFQPPPLSPVAPVQTGRFPERELEIGNLQGIARLGCRLQPSGFNPQRTS